MLQRAGKKNQMAAYVFEQPSVIVKILMLTVHFSN